EEREGGGEGKDRRGGAARGRGPSERDADVVLEVQLALLAGIPVERVRAVHAQEEGGAAGRPAQSRPDIVAPTPGGFGPHPPGAPPVVERDERRQVVSGYEARFHREDRHVPPVELLAFVSAQGALAPEVELLEDRHVVARSSPDDARIEDQVRSELVVRAHVADEAGEVVIAAPARAR